MTGLNKIIEKIISEAHDRARVTVEQARRRCIEISNEYADRREREKQALVKDAEEEARAIVAESKATAEQAKKEALLKTKAELVESVFLAAIEEVKALPDEKYAILLGYLAQTALLELAEGLGESAKERDFELLLAKKDLDRCGKLVHTDLCRRATRELGKETAKRITLSDTPASIYGGAIIRCDGTEINAPFSRLFEGLREKLSGEVESYLFAEEKQ